MKFFIKYILFSVIVFTAFAANADIRTAESYHCTAFNPLTGYAFIKWNRQTVRATGGAVIRYGWLENEAKGGLMTYEPEVAVSYPRAVLNTQLNGNEVAVYMDLLRPLEHRSKEVVLAGLTYVPVTVPVSNIWPWNPMSGTLGHLSPIVPLPAGFVPTSTVTCRVKFR